MQLTTEDIHYPVLRILRNLHVFTCLDFIHYFIVCSSDVKWDFHYMFSQVSICFSSFFRSWTDFKSSNFFLLKQGIVSNSIQQSSV